MNKYFITLFLLFSININAATVLGTGSDYPDILAALNQNYISLEASENGLFTEAKVLGEKYMAGQEMMNEMNSNIQDALGSTYAKESQSILEECFAVEMPELGFDLDLDFGFCGADALGRLLDKASKDFANEIKSKTEDGTNITTQCKEYNTFYSKTGYGLLKTCKKYYKENENIKVEDNEPESKLSKDELKDIIKASSKKITTEVDESINNNNNVKNDFINNLKEKTNDIISLELELNKLKNNFNQRYNINEAKKIKKSDTLNYKKGEADASSHLIPIFDKELNTVSFVILPGIEKETIKETIKESYISYSKDDEKAYNKNILNFLNNNGGSTPFTNAFLANEYYKSFIASKIYGSNSNNLESEETTSSEESSQGEEGFKKANVLAQQNISFQLLMLNQQLENQIRMDNKVQLTKIKILSSLLIDINKEVRILKIQNKFFLNNKSSKNIKTNEIIIKNDKIKRIIVKKTEVDEESINCEYNWDSVNKICLCDFSWTEEIKIANNAKCIIGKKD